MKHNIQIFDVASQSSIHIAMNKKCDLLDIEIHIDFNMYQQIPTGFHWVYVHDWLLLFMNYSIKQF